MAVSERNCVCCDDRPAAMSFEPHRGLALRVVQRMNVDVSSSDLVIPLCNRCQQALTDAYDDFNRASSDNLETANRFLNQLIDELDVDEISEASRCVPE